MINLVDNVNSTNSWLSQFNLNYYDSIISLKQSEGRGRQGRTWDSEKGGFYYSIILPNKNLLPIIVGVSVAEILFKKEVPIKLKWPNDILVDGKKLGGILCQSHGEKVTVGLGINVSNKPNLEHSINLSTLGINIDYLHFAHKLNDKIRNVMDLSDEEIVQHFLIYDCLIGKQVCWNGSEGIAVKVSEDGRLVVRNYMDELIFLTDEVHLK